MSDNSAIEWTDHTFNPWWGCSRVSPACRFCYADRDARRYGHELWRRHGPRRMLSESAWKRPVIWNRNAERLGIPAKVFCASMADVFEDHPQVAEPRKRLWDLIDSTPWLIWQLLTKRIENVWEMAPWGNAWPDNVWLGTSVENQVWAERRLPILREIPAKVRFLSCEPLLDATDIGLTEDAGDYCTCAGGTPESSYLHEPHCGLEPGPSWSLIHWVIAGGESGPKARRSELEWFTSLRDQCAIVGVPFFMKQAGAVLAREWGCSDRKGHVPAEWPAHFPRAFPAAAEAVPA